MFELYKDPTYLFLVGGLWSSIGVYILLQIDTIRRRISEDNGFFLKLCFVVYFLTAVNIFIFGIGTLIVIYYTLWRH